MTTIKQDALKSIFVGSKVDEVTEEHLTAYAELLGVSSASRKDFRGARICGLVENAMGQAAKLIEQRDVLSESGSITAIEELMVTLFISTSKFIIESGIPLDEVFLDVDSADALLTKGEQSSEHNFTH